MCFSLFHSLAEMIGGCKTHGHMTGVCLLTLLSPTSIEDEVEAGSESERAHSYQNI